MPTLGNGTINATCNEGNWSASANFSLIGDDAEPFGACNIADLASNLTQDEAVELMGAMNTVIGAVTRYCQDRYGVTLG